MLLHNTKPPNKRSSKCINILSMCMKLNIMHRHARIWRKALSGVWKWCYKKSFWSSVTGKGKLSHFPGTAAWSRIWHYQEGNRNAHSCPLWSQKRDFCRPWVIYAYKPLLEVTGPHWEGQAHMQTRGFEVSEVPCNCHASAFRHLSKWQIEFSLKKQIKYPLRIRGIEEKIHSP